MSLEENKILPNNNGDDHCMNLSATEVVNEINGGMQPSSP